jgi:hypothetical protein
MTAATAATVTTTTVIFRGKNHQCAVKIEVGRQDFRPEVGGLARAMKLRDAALADTGFF